MTTNRLFALGLMMALASGACGDDSGSKPTTLPDGGQPAAGDSGATPDGGDSGVAPGVDGGPTVLPNPDGGPSVIVNPDGGPPVVIGGSGTKLITGAGGSVTSADGNLTVTFPRNAFVRPTTVSITVANPAPMGVKGPVYNILPTTEPFVTQPAPVVTVTLKYTAADLGTGGSPENLKVGQYIGGKWVELIATNTFGAPSPNKANPSNMTVTAQIAGLGPVALLSGICVDCKEAACTVDQACPMATDPTQTGKCFASGNGCTICRLACDLDKDGTCSPSDCNDNDPNINGSVQELCDNGGVGGAGIDENCNGHINEGCNTCKVDSDCKNAFEACTGGFCTVCSAGCTGACTLGMPAVAGVCHQFGVNATCSTCYQACDHDFDGVCTTKVNDYDPFDCNDADPNVNSGAPEICGNNIDDNCDGKIDDNCTTCTTDNDCPMVTTTGDAPYGLTCIGQTCVACKDKPCDMAACGATGGTCQNYGKGCSRCVALCDDDADGYCTNQNDVDNHNPAISPAQAELCGNKIDDNSNYHTDEGCNPCTSDADCSASSFEFCNPHGACDICSACDVANCRWPLNAPMGTATVAGTCTSFGRGCGTCVPPGDKDGDGYVTPEVAAMAFAAKPPVVLPGGDCDDTIGTGATINPDPKTPEICGNMKDDNCNGRVDELCTTCDASMMCGLASQCDNSR